MGPLIEIADSTPPEPLRPLTRRAERRALMRDIAGELQAAIDTTAHVPQSDDCLILTDLETIPFTRGARNSGRSKTSG